MNVRLGDTEATVARKQVADRLDGFLIRLRDLYIQEGAYGVFEIHLDLEKYIRELRA
jgi:hypothetical protein